MEADMETGIFTKNAAEECKLNISQIDGNFLSNELKSILADYISGCVNIYDEIELKGRLIDYIRKM
jgi:hypothetical protein